MELNMKFQLLALAVIGIVIIDYTRSKRLPIMSTRIFGVFMVTAGVNILADIWSYYTLTHMSVVGEVHNRLAHQVLIGSLDIFVYLLFLYVYYLAGAQKRLQWLKLMLTFLPFLGAFGFAMFAPLHYVDDDIGSYAHGAMLNVFYLAICIYVVAIIVVLFRKNKAYSRASMSNILPSYRRAKVTILVGLAIWIAVTVVQFITKYWLISGIGVALMVLYIYINFENPREYTDSEINTFSQRAFHIMVPEMLARGKSFYLVNLYIDEVEQLHKVLGYEQTREIMRSAAKQIRSAMPGMRIYHSGSYVLSVFFDTREELDKLIMHSESWNFSHRTVDGGSVSLLYHISVMECPKYAATVDDVYDTLDYSMKDKEHHENGKIYFVTDEMVEKKNFRLAVLAVLTEAVKNKAFDVVYQPIYSAEKKCFASAEALVRLQDEQTLGYVSPEFFIPLAEEKGLIGEIGNIVFEKVCSFAAREKLWELGLDYIEVNLSGMQSVDLGLVAQLTGIMKKYGVRPEFFNLEITETASVDGGEMLRYNMDALRRAGCHFSMDDFGTGYSNLSQMAKVHFELVKLDKSLIWPCFDENAEEPSIILNSCIDMILQLGVKIVAEGVETREQAELLIEKGVAYLQGYYFSRPVGEEEFIAKVKAGVEI